LHTLKQQVQEFVIEQAMKEQEKIQDKAEADLRAQLLLNPDVGFAERYEAVMTDMLAGRHVNQIHPDDPSLFKDLIDNQESDDENPTNEF
jgi:hypothetical protein